MIRDLKLFSILDDDQKDDLLVPAIHDEGGYRTIRETLAAQYNLGNREPNVCRSESIDRRGDRSLTLRHQQHDRKPLGDSTEEVLKHLHRLWGFDIHLETLQGDQVDEDPPCSTQRASMAKATTDAWTWPSFTFSSEPDLRWRRQGLSCGANGGFFMRIYKVGGAVRDRLLGRPVTDIDSGGGRRHGRGHAGPRISPCRQPISGISPPSNR